MERRGGRGGGRRENRTWRGGIEWEEEEEKRRRVLFLLLHGLEGEKEKREMKGKEERRGIRIGVEEEWEGEREW